MSTYRSTERVTAFVVAEAVADPEGPQVTLTGTEGETATVLKSQISGFVSDPQALVGLAYVLRGAEGATPRFLSGDDFVELYEREEA